MLVAERRRFADAARIFGHGHRVYADNRLPLEPAELKVTQRAEALLRAALNAEDFERLAAEGGQLDERAALALRASPRPRFRTIQVVQGHAHPARRRLLRMPSGDQKSVRKRSGDGKDFHSVWRAMRPCPTEFSSPSERSCTCPGTCDRIARSLRIEGLHPALRAGDELLGENAAVTLFLVENAVLGARAGAKVRDLEKIARAGVRILADDFALRERGIAELAPNVVSVTSTRWSASWPAARKPFGTNCHAESRRIRP